MIRSLIAIDLPEATRQGLAAVQEQPKQSRARVRWVKVSSIHLTLKFLGNIHPGQVDDSAETAALVFRNEQSLTLYAEGLGAFPSQRKPRVIWIGLQSQVERLGRIQARLEKALQSFGIAIEHTV